MESKQTMENMNVISTSVPMRSEEEDRVAGATSNLLTSARDAIAASVVLGGGSFLFVFSLLGAAVLSRLE